MRDHAWIDFEWRGKTFRWKGEWPAEMKSAIGQAHIRLSGLGRRFSWEDLIREAGATILAIHSIRPDGSIHSEDLPDLKLY